MLIELIGAPTTRAHAISCVDYSEPVNWMRKHDHSLLSNAASLLICGLLAGLVVAAAAFPAIAMSGLAAKAGADGFDNLPSVLQVPHAPQSTLVYASDGKTLITSLYDENRRDVTIDQIAPVMLQAVVASEDARFYQHNGVDIKGVVRALVADQNAGAQQGASTLTMQYVRLAISYSATTPQEVIDATEDSPARKIREMHYAIALEKQLTKENNGDQHAAKLEVLNRYLNIAPFGHGAFGIYAASEVYFSEQPKDLTLPQAALLAGLLQATTEYDPTTTAGLPKALDRRNGHVLPNMLKLGYITQAQFNATAATPIKVVPHATPNGCTATIKPGWAFFCDYLYRWWLSQPAFGADAYTRENQLETGGYKIITSMNVQAENGAVKAVLAQDPIGRSTAMMLAGVEPGTGRVQVMAVNRNYSNDMSHNGPITDPIARANGKISSYPNTTLPLLSGIGGGMGYQFGSTFKMFTMIAALEKGVPLDYKINTTYQYTSNWKGPDPTLCGGLYCPINASPTEHGIRDMWTGFGQSVNTYFVPLEERVGVDNVVNVAERLGLSFPDVADPDIGSFTLGTLGASPLEMSAAYAAVAASGLYCTPTPVISITDFSGQKLDIAKPQCNQAIDPNVANTALDAARCPLGDQSAFGQCSYGTAGYVRQDVGRPVAGKTGTTDGGVAAALIAMTPQLAIAGILTDPDYQIPRAPMNHHAINVAVWVSLKRAMQGLPVEQFAVPDRSLAFGIPSAVPKVDCMTVAAATQHLTAAGFHMSAGGPMKTPIPSACPAGTVAKSDPSGVSVKGGYVALYLSNGAAPPPNPNPSGSPSGPGGPGKGGGGPGGGGGGGGPGGGGGGLPCLPPVFCPPGGGGH